MNEIHWELDSKDARFLESVKYHGGEATMRQIRERSGLGRSAANHRFSKLEDLELITVHKRPHKGQEIKVAVWTQELKEEVEENNLFGYLESSTLHSQDIYHLQNEVRELKSQLSQMENKLNAVSSSANDNRGEINSIGDWSYRVNQRIAALSQAIMSATEENPVDYIPD